MYPANGGLGRSLSDFKTNDGLVAHTPFHNYMSNSGTGTIDFMHAEYSKNDARSLSQGNNTYDTFQAMLCTVGGGEPASGESMWFVGSAVTLNRSPDLKIGQKWGTGTTSASISATLSFQLTPGKGSASIGGSVPVNIGQGTYTGDIGPDGKIPAISLVVKL